MKYTKLIAGVLLIACSMSAYANADLIQKEWDKQIAGKEAYSVYWDKRRETYAVNKNLELTHQEWQEQIDKALEAEINAKKVWYYTQRLTPEYYGKSDTQERLEELIERRQKYIKEREDWEEYGLWGRFLCLLINNPILCKGD